MDVPRGFGPPQFEPIVGPARIAGMALIDDAGKPLASWPFSDGLPIVIPEGQYVQGVEAQGIVIRLEYVKEGLR